MSRGVRYHKQGDSALGIYALKQFHNLGSPLLVETSRRLVEEDNAGRGDESAGERHSLLLAAGQLARQIAEPFFYAEEGADFGDGIGEILLFLAVEHKRQHDVFVRREMGNEIVELIDEGNLAPAHCGKLFVAGLGKIPAEEHYAALGGLVHAREKIKKGGFAGARLAHHGDEFAVGDFDVHASQHFRFHGRRGIDFFKPLRFENDFAHKGPLFTSISITQRARALNTAREKVQYEKRATVVKARDKCYHNAVETVDERIGLIAETGRGKRLLLHVCCGPCAAGVLPAVTPHFDVTLFYYNPNILPKAEFIKRLDTLKQLLEHFPAVRLIVPEQDGEEFLSLARGKENVSEGGARCTDCFRLRLSRTAEYLAAHAGEYDAFATTLTVSPRKNAPLINAVGQAAAEATNTVYLASDFKKRDGYLTSVRLCKEYGLYRQHYCGCGFPAAAEVDVSSSASSADENRNIQLADYEPSYCEATARLFSETIYATNAKDYSPEQLRVWSRSACDLVEWDRSFEGNKAVVAVCDGKVLGFGDITPDGYLNRLYVHKDHLRRGIASLICDKLESFADGNVVVHASITAKPFFAQRSYEEVRKNFVERDGMLLANFVMIKTPQNRV